MMQSSLAIQRAQALIDASLYLSKLTKLLRGLIILFSATQFGLHFWPDSSLVYGIRIDYLSPTLYFLDVLIILYLVISRFTGNLSANSKASFLILIVIALSNLVYSQNPLSTLSWSLHFLLYAAFIFSHKFSNFRNSLINWIPALLVVQLLIAGTQVALGHSLGGIFYYLGERLLAVGAPGVALGSLGGQVILRAYGTFGHPNVLAGWAVVVCYLYLRVVRTGSFRALVAILSSLIAVLTQSRSAALALFFIIIPFFYLKKTLSRAIYFLLASYLALSLSYFNPTRFDFSVRERGVLASVSGQIITHYPVFGVGAQSSISAYPLVVPENRLLQPDHNLFTLALSWFGLAAIIGVIIHFLPHCRSSIIFFVPLLPLSLLDHYFATSPQGLFVFITTFYVGVNYLHVQKNRQQHAGTTRR